MKYSSYLKLSYKYYGVEQGPAKIPNCIPVLAGMNKYLFDPTSSFTDLRLTYKDQKSDVIYEIY
jgi:hypothetical protein